MTRVTSTNQHSASNNYQSRGHTNLQSRTFKKSYTRDRTALSSISLNHQNQNNRNNHNKRRNCHPFNSFQPNKSGRICPPDTHHLLNDDSNEPSDFSHFLSHSNSPQTTTNNLKPHQQHQQHSKHAINATNSNSPCKNNHNSQSNMISSQSRSNQNIPLKDKNPHESTDDFIFAGLQIFNSISVPYHDKKQKQNQQVLNTNNHNNNNNQLRPYQSMQRSLNDSNNVKRRNLKYGNNKQFTLDYIPFDWCLKRTLYFVSDASLDWCCSISLKVRNAAMHHISLESLQIDSELERKQYKFYKNMIYHKYPHNKWDQSQLTILHKFYLKHSQQLKPLEKYKDRNKIEQFGMVKSMNAFSNNEHGNNQNHGEFVYNTFIDRLCEWMESFHSLYALYRQQFCQYIYIHFPGFFNIIFCFDQTDKDNLIPRVIITNTHQSFRNTLKKQNIIFSTPFIDKKDKFKHDDKENCNDGDDEDDEDMVDLEEYQRNGINVRMNKKRNAMGMGLRYNNNDRTVTLIEGKRNVHNFYDFLINYMHKLCLSIKKCHDIPLLFCNELFLNSKCCLIEMSKNYSGLTEKKQKMYTMQLDGYILPNMQYQIIKLLFESSQNAEISCQVHDKMMDGINYCAKVPLFQKLKDAENRHFTSINKIKVNAKEKACTVYLQ